jgi:hypothetical protein
VAFKNHSKAFIIKLLQEILDRSWLHRHPPNQGRIKARRAAKLAAAAAKSDRKDGKAATEAPSAAAGKKAQAGKK